MTESPPPTIEVREVHEVHHDSVLSRPVVRGLVVAVVIFAVIMCWGGIKLIDLTDQIQTTQRINHDKRVEDQKRTDREIAQLACVIVSQTNEDDPKAKLTPEQRRAVRQFRAFYGCPPYSTDRARNPLGKATPSPTSPAQPHGSNTVGTPQPGKPSPHSSRVDASGRSSSPPSHPPSRVTATRTITTTPPAPPVPPGLLPIPSCTIQVGPLKLC